MSTTQAEQAAALTEAFHLVFDVKDANWLQGTSMVEAYDALAAIKTLMISLDIPTPNRYDGEGRPNQKEQATS